MRDCLQRVNKTAEVAMAQSLGGDPGGAVQNLLADAERTLNSKLLDMAQQVLLRHSARMAAPEPLQAAIDALRTRMGTAPARAILGQDSERHPGGVALRVRSSGDNAPARIPPPPQDSLAVNPAPTDEADDPAAARRHLKPRRLARGRPRPLASGSPDFQRLTKRRSNRQASALEAEKHLSAACCQGSHS